MPRDLRCPNPTCGATVALADDGWRKPVVCSRCRLRFAVDRPGPNVMWPAPAAPGALSHEGRDVHDASLTKTHVRPLAGGRQAHSPRNATESPSHYGVVPITFEPGMPDRIGRFQLRARLGSGAFGVVYRAYDPHLERDVALKLAAIETLDASEVERYVHEARAAARLRHPRIVPVFEAGREGNYAYIASAYVPGETLADMAATGRIDPSEHRRIARIVRDVADALVYAHNLGIIHRDVKPSNILIDEEGKAHLLDFGLAVRREDPARSGEVAGTPQYLSPEVVRGERATAASDQYGLGIVLYFLLTGEPPFTGDLGEVLEAIEETTPAAPHVITTSSPKALSTACIRAIAKLPRDRYPDCRAFADSLRSWLKRDAAGPIEQFVGSLPEIDRFTRGMNRWRGATNLAAVFVGIAILSLLFYSFWEIVTIVRTKESQLKARPTALVEPVNTSKSP